MPKYKNNQITEMLCQIRFSTILKINNESDESLSKFQEKIKEKFPNYQMINENVVNVEMSGGEENIESITPQILRNNIKNHMFISNSGNKRINLTCNFISLSINEYESWKKFKEDFIWILDNFNQVYKIENFNRIGIRYINAFSKTELGINEQDNWNQYISEDIVGLSSKYNVKVYNSNIEIPFDDNSQMRIISGLGTKQNKDNSILPVFIIDKDTYKLGNIEKGNIDETLENLHSHNSEIFESLIKQNLRDKMGVMEDD